MPSAMVPGVFLSRFLFLGFQLMLVCGILQKTLWDRNKPMDDLLPSSASSAVSVHFKGACALQCKRQNGCKGVFYNENSQTCIMTSYVHLKDGSEDSSPGTRYFTPPPSASLSCPVNGTTVLNEQSSTCFQLRDVATNWTYARDACNTDHGRLAVLDNSGKLEALMTYFRTENLSNAFYYIGGLRPYVAWNTPWPNGQPDFIWLNGKLVSYTSPFWSSTDPNRPGGGEDILVIYPSTTWFLGNFFPNYSLKYVCEFAMY